jgi:hypothetical protein
VADARDHACANFARLRQVHIQFLLVEQRLHGLITILIELFSLLIGIAPLGGQGLILICHLMLQLEKCKGDYTGEWVSLQPCKETLSI